MKKIRIAQIGTEHDHAKQVIDTLSQLFDVFELVGYCHTQEELDGINQGMYTDEKYKDYKKFTLSQILAMDDLDAVAIEAEDAYLVKYANMFAQKGVHVHMDKPGSQSAQDVEEMLSNMKKSGKIFSIGYMYRHNPAIKRILEKVENGELGEIFCVEAQMSRNDGISKRKWLGSYKGGMNFFLGCHLIDLIVQIQGIPEKVIPLSCSTNLDGVDSQDYGMALLVYKNGISFEKTCASERGGFARRQLVVCGSKGTIEIKPLEESVDAYRKKSVLSEAIVTSGDYYEWSTPIKRSQDLYFHRYAEMLMDFADRIKSNEQGKYTLEYEALIHRIILCACSIPCDYKAEIKL